MIREHTIMTPDTPSTEAKSGLNAGKIAVVFAIGVAVAAFFYFDLGRFLQHGGALSLPRSDGRHPLSAMVAPIAVTGLFPSSRSASVVVLIEQPAQRSSAPLSEFTRTHGLSPAETGIASRLVRGMSLRQAAAELGISDNTARSHLKHVFAKTGARRQSDLVRRALTYQSDGEKSS